VREQGQRQLVERQILEGQILTRQGELSGIYMHVICVTLLYMCTIYIIYAQVRAGAGGDGFEGKEQLTYADVC